MDKHHTHQQQLHQPRHTAWAAEQHQQHHQLKQSEPKPQQGGTAAEAKLLLVRAPATVHRGDTQAEQWQRGLLAQVAAAAAESSEPQHQVHSEHNEHIQCAEQLACCAEFQLEDQFLEPQPCAVLGVGKQSTCQVSHQSDEPRCAHRLARYTSDS